MLYSIKCLYFKKDTHMSLYGTGGTHNYETTICYKT